MTIAADRSGRIGNEGNDDDGNDNEGNGNEGRKKLEFCDLYQASHRLRETDERIDPICQEKHAMMVVMHDTAALFGTPLPGEEISRKCLGESKTKNYIRGFGNGPKPSTYLSKSKSQLACQDQL
ncbi:uncharacterized protein LOC131304765 isoform X2 [Rhododendron vialii]|uniref:uncharacterized protein LOC131304765 isoform X2 n=1 Tax=Rhododendron vialii TaxID=182163 RepID=UPI00265E519B|nr:uncharacterized protein LOC131304765 isoform X2 [Rhododendron vialii]